ncbi:uncharacterized protein LOC144859804 [Branchiostoma floridae x Branchiostoma japonicum]
MARKQHMLVFGFFLLIILREPAKTEATCSCSSDTSCSCDYMQLTSIPQNLSASITDLYLRYNEITTLSQSDLSRYRSLRVLYLNNNHILIIDDHAFYYQSSLTNLDVHQNKLTCLTADMFVRLDNMVYLDLSSNHIASIAEGTFTPTPQLQHLYMHQNNLTSIPQHLFDGLNKLLYLWVHDNHINAILSDTFASLQQLVELHLYNNQISTIPQRIFVDLPQLEQLFLHSNKITSIQSGAFSNLPKVQVLRLDDNKLQTISPGLFRDMENLQQLHLQNNQLISIPTDIVQHYLLELTHLYLYNNSITHIPDLAFSNHPKLTTLHLYTNRISTVSPTTFRGLAYLTTLYLYDNYLEDLPDHPFVGLPNLRDLRLQNNAISNVSPNTFAGISRLSHLNLSDNIIQSFPLAAALSKIEYISSLYLQNNQMQILLPSAHDKLASISTVDIENNPWHCDCRMVPFRQKMTGSYSFENQITCQEPRNFLGQKLKDINPEDLTCEEPRIVRFGRSDTNVTKPLVPWGTLHLVCEASGIPPPDITVTLPSGQNVTVGTVGRVTMETDGNITIANLTAADSGQYKCVAVNIEGFTSDTLSVTVAQITTSTPLIIITNSSLTIINASSLIPATVQPESALTVTEIVAIFLGTFLSLLIIGIITYSLRRDRYGRRGITRAWERFWKRPGETKSPLMSFVSTFDQNSTDCESAGACNTLGTNSGQIPTDSSNDTVPKATGNDNHTSHVDSAAGNTSGANFGSSNSFNPTDSSNEKVPNNYKMTGDDNHTSHVDSTTGNTSGTNRSSSNSFNRTDSLHETVPKTTDDSNHTSYVNSAGNRSGTNRSSSNSFNRTDSLHETVPKTTDDSNHTSYVNSAAGNTSSANPGSSNPPNPTDSSNETAPKTTGADNHTSSADSGFSGKFGEDRTSGASSGPSHLDPTLPVPMARVKPYNYRAPAAMSDDGHGNDEHESDATLDFIDGRSEAQVPSAEIYASSSSTA